MGNEYLWQCDVTAGGSLRITSVTVVGEMPARCRLALEGVTWFLVML